jgi:hypothetical protein
MILEHRAWESFVYISKIFPLTLLINPHSLFLLA